MDASTKPPSTTIAFPILAIAFVILAPLIGFDAGVQPPSPSSLMLSAAMIVIMLGAVFAAVHHADVIAHRVGEPYGTLVLTLAVTVIEVALIELIVLTPGSSPALARDTVFAVIMIVCNGLVGLCVLWGGLRHHEQEFQASGASVYLSVLGALSILTLVLPNYTATIGPYFSNGQLVFVSITTIILYVAFLFIQTSRHTNYFRADDGNTRNGSKTHPSSKLVAVSVVMLLAALCGVILIAKKFAIILEIGLSHIGAPQAVAGIIIAMVVLTPESITAVRAARRNELQKSSQPRTGLVLGNNRTNDSCRCDNQHLSRQANRAWPLGARHVTPRAHTLLEPAHIRVWPDQYSRRARPPGGFRHVLISSVHSLVCRFVDKAQILFPPGISRMERCRAGHDNSNKQKQRDRVLDPWSRRSASLRLL